ncbi:MAG: UDP-2,4-diacetamido-2,4,6-trideoxy-beta-L-altropyranose hydrolase [bacterium]
MNVAFRVDASTQIGTGHIMRCMTLADELERSSAQIRFICRHLPEHLHEMLVAKGYQVALLESAPDKTTSDQLAHADWLGVSQAQDSIESENALSGKAWDWLIVDHYALDVHWENTLRDTTKQIMVIDDIADRQHDCDVLLDQNFYADLNYRYSGKVPQHCQLLLGPRYALLRDEFQELHRHIKPREGIVKRLLVFFGGIDANNYTGRTIEALTAIGLNNLQVDVVIGVLHPCREQIEDECIKHGFTCHVQTNQMARLIADAGMAIGSGGSTIWERCCLGLPTITICAADNQRRQIEDASSVGLLYAPNEIKGEGDMVKHHLISLLENTRLRQLFSRNGIQTVDGRGAIRVVDAMGYSGIEIRTATLEDSDRLFEWRNHPKIRAVSRNSDIIKRGDHDHWLASVLNNTNQILLIGQRNGKPIGVVRFDIQNSVAEVSIYLAPDANNSGWGKSLLRSAEIWFTKNYSGVNKIHAKVLASNERSHLLFRATGYQNNSTNYYKELKKS